MLEVLASIAMIVAAGVMIWANAFRTVPPASPSGRTPIAVPVEPVSIAGAPVLGDVAATVVMIEFADFECPYCARFVREVLPEIKRRYIDTGRLQLAFLHNPLDRVHSRARPAAEAAQCADRQGRFWSFHDELFGDPSTLQEGGLLDTAAKVGIDAAAFKRCREGEARDRVEQDGSLARSLNLTGTPAFVLGRLRPDGAVDARAVVSGAKPLKEFLAIIDPILKDHVSVPRPN